MKESPILFTPANYQAILDGSKTQTRRIVKNPDRYSCLTGDCPHEDRGLCDAEMPVLCPYGIIGDRLYIKEGFTYWECEEGVPLKRRGKFVRCENLTAQQQASMIERALHVGEDYLVYKNDGVKRSLSEWKYPHPIYEHCIGNFRKSISPLFMPKWAARLWLEIVEVRVQRLQEISEEDAAAEGAFPMTGDAGDNYRRGFRFLWESINGAGSWDRNDWVWALTVKVVAP